jgi:formylglycine-generating enzyme required for sulfatase activity
MKTPATLLLFFIFLITLNGQDKSFEQEPQGMVFIPQGSFDMKNTSNAGPAVRKITVDAFWMSNEVTNKEFREFADWAKNNPGEKLNQVKFSVTTVTDPVKGSTKDTVVMLVNPIEVSTFSSTMIDSTVLEKVNANYKNYFTDLKYNDCPVVGVSFKMAEYYCIWKTMLENRSLEKKGLPAIQWYRIPLETEWEYVAQQPITKKVTETVAGTLQRVDEGDMNEWGLYHFSNNVSEWVSASRGGALVRGGSWKSEGTISVRQQIDINSREAYIGFRIVRSYVSGKR